MKPPTFFISSTIHDFKDLRSAIKYYLEAQGCKVLASEFNDFPRVPDKHSYEVCLQNIRQSDWFVLLIGGRVGGWIDEVNRVSITMQEYRDAYDLHRQRRLKLLCFVRSEVWRLKEDRRELARFLEAEGVDPGLKKRIVNHPGRAAEDAEFLIQFIDEVGRNKETLTARKAGTPLPTGNWINEFRTFRDIVDAIQFQPFGGAPVEEAGLRRLLRRELLGAVRVSLVRAGNGGHVSPRRDVVAFNNYHRILPADRDNKAFRVNTELFDALRSLSVHLMQLRYHLVILQKALESTAFMKYDPLTGRFEETPVYGALHALAEEVRLFTKSNTFEILKVALETGSKFHPVRHETMAVDGLRLIGFLHLMDRWCNVISLCKAIVLHLDGPAFVMPKLRPQSPMIGMDEALTHEAITDAEAEWFISRP